jgi:CRP-like cAMP-binding protein
MSEDGTQQLLLRKGSGRVLVPGVGSDGLIPVAELRPGQAFGLSALLGEPTGAVLEATGALSLLSLDAQGIERLMQRLPAVARALRGNQVTAVSPVRGRRLGYSGTFARPPELSRVAAPAP